MSHDLVYGLVKLTRLKYALSFQFIAAIVIFFNFDQIELEYIDNPEEFHHRVKQGDHCVTKIDDIERNGYCFTDGNGLMSRGLARLVAERLGYLVKFNDEVCFNILTIDF
jgi:hypothetical protein